MGRNTHGHEYTHTHESNTTIIMTECLYSVYQEVIEYKKSVMSVVIEGNCHKGRGNGRYDCLMHQNL